MEPITIKGIFCPPRGDVAEEHFQALVKRIVEVEQETCGYVPLTAQVDEDDCLIINVGESDNDLQISMACGPLRKLLREAAEQPRKIARSG